MRSSSHSARFSPVWILGAALLLPLACAGPQGEHLTAAEYQARERGALGEKVDAEASQDRDAQAERLALQRQADEREGRQADEDHALRELNHRRERAVLEQRNAEADQAWALQSAQVALAHARADLERFMTRERPMRLERDSLNLTEAQDGLLETREELAQLEMMYTGAELGQGTAEIVLERTRRRVLRAERYLALAQQESVLLRELELPREQADQERQVQAQIVALAKAERSVELGRLEREAALRDLDHEQSQIERRLRRLDGERIELDSKLRALERSELARMDAGLSP